MADKVNINKDGVTAELYTKSAVDGLLGGKADKNNPEFSGQMRSGDGNNILVLDTHPEGGKTVLGVYENDLAYCCHRGGSCRVKDLTTGTVISENNDGIFDCTNKYGYTGGNLAGHTIEAIVKCPSTSQWQLIAGINFGNEQWAVSELQIVAGYSPTRQGTAQNPDSDIVWGDACVFNNPSSLRSAYATYVHSKDSTNAINYLKFTFVARGYLRICSIFIKTSSSEGLAAGYLNRGGGNMYGGIGFAGSAGIFLNNGHIEFNTQKPDLNLIDFISEIVGRCCIGYGGGDGGVWNPNAGIGKDNLIISSWYSIGFHDTCFNHDYISMNVRDGIFRAKKLQDADTGKQTSIGDLATATELDEVRKIAEGKTDTYAVKAQGVDSTKYCNNKLNIAKSELGTTSVRIDKQGITKLLDINKVEIDLSTLKIGDIVFTAEQTIKDWWFAGTTADYYLFYGFDADTPDLSGYVKNTELANYTPLTDFNNLSGSLGTASGCDYAAGIDDVLIEPSVPGAKKQLPTVGAVRNFVNTWFVRKTSLGAAANYAVDSTSDSIKKDSTNLPTTGAMVAYLENNYLKNTAGFGTAAWKNVDTGNIQYPGSKEKVPTTFAIVEYVHNDAKTKIKTIRAGTNNGETFIGYEYTNSSTCIVKGLNNAAYKDVDDTITSANGVTLSKNLPTSAAVANYLASNLKTINGNPIFGKGDIPLTIATLPSTGSMSSLALTDRLDLQNAPYGIKFSSAAYAVTNMEAGEVEIVLGKYVNNDASASVTFHNGSKGQGTWKVLATVTGKTWVTSVTCTIESITTSGFKIWVRRLVDTSSNSASGTVTVDWFAIKYW